jgi:hypothetical protein
MLTAAGTLHAQGVADHTALGDREHAAFRPEAALGASKPPAIDSLNAHALSRPRRAVDLAKGRATRPGCALFRLGEKYGRRAVAVAPDDAASYFNLARALGRAALNVGVRERVKYAVDIRNQALAALKIDPDHPGALHVIGMWNAESCDSMDSKILREKASVGRSLVSQWKDAVYNLGAPSGRPRTLSQS